MKKGQSYQGKVAPGRGLGAPLMSKPGVRERLQRLMRLPVVPGTLNVYLGRPFDYPLTRRIDLVRLGIEPHELGLDGDSMWYHWVAVVIAEEIPGILIHRHAPDYPDDLVELMSDRNLRQSLGLNDGDDIQFAVIESD